MDEIMTLEEVAKYLRVSERSVYEWASKGELPGGKIGTSWRFKRSEVEQWVNRRLSPQSITEATTEAAEGIRIPDILSKHRIGLFQCNSKEEILEALVDLCAEVPGIGSREALARAVQRRESLMSTGIGFSVAVPHVRLTGVKQVHMAVGINSKGLSDYQSLDGRPVRIVVLIIAGREQHAQYLKVLSTLSDLLKKDYVREKLLSAQTPEAVYKILTGLI